jgi:hypothetical protein
MSVENIFRLQLVAGYVAWLLCFRAYLLPKLRSVDRVQAHIAIATLHSFRFFGLVFLIPGIVGAQLPAGFAIPTAWGDFTTGILALFALPTVRIRPLFWFFIVIFNLVGMADLILAYIHAMQFGVPAIAGQLGATYFIPVLYVPLLMITHIVAVYWMLRPQLAPRGLGVNTVAS